jgi:hypothetical protein
MARIIRDIFPRRQKRCVLCRCRRRQLLATLKRMLSQLRTRRRPETA